MRTGSIVALALWAASAGANETTGPAQPAAPTPQPPEAFAELPLLETPKLSPDGTRMAVKLAVEGEQVLAILPLFKGAGERRLLGTKNDVDINWWRWVGNDWLAVGVGAQDRVYNQEIYVTRTLGVSADLQKTVRLDWQDSGIRADDVLWAAQEGSPRILLSRQTGIQTMDQIYPEVIEVDVSTGKTKQVAAGRTNVFNWYADGAGRLRMGYRYDDDTRTGTLLYRGNDAEPFRSIATRKRGDDNAMPIPLIFRADGSAVATDQGSGFDGVYEVSLPDLKLGKKLYGLDGYDVDGVVENAAGDTLDGISVTDRYRHVVWLDPAMKEVQGLIDAALKNQRGRIVSWDRTRRLFLVEVGSASQPGALYLFDPTAGKMFRHSWMSEQLKGRILSPVSTIRYAARDGTPIEAVLTLPRGREAKRLAVIVMPHGGPFARDAESWDWWAQYLAEVGYAVIQPNYRGSSGYGREFEKKAEGQWGLKMQDDLDDALAWAVKEGIADPKRACMAGASYGGYAAMRAAQRDGDKYRCAISYAGVSDMGAMRAYDGQFLNGKTRSDWLKRQAPDFRAISPRFGAAGFGAPILIMHGRVDKRVPVRQSRMMADALKAAGKPYEYVEQPLGDHHFSRSADRLEFLKRVKTFLDRYNPA